jgi:Flp pilus assembly protein CpaB
LFVGYVAKDAKAAKGTYRGITQAEGRITGEIIKAGQAIRDESLLALGESLPDLSERLPAGYRAVTIVVQGADTGGKRLAEGDFIDIAMTVEGTHPDLGEVTTRTLLKNVLVVDAAESRPLVRGARKAKDDAGSQITVAVTPVEANRLLVAQRTGILQAQLVSASDPAPTAGGDNAINRRQLLGLKDLPRKYTVEKWVGNELKIIEMSNDRVRESRDVTNGRRGIPVSQPVPANNDVSRNATDLDHATGVKTPEIAVAANEDSLVAAVAVAPESK